MVTDRNAAADHKGVKVGQAGIACTKLERSGDTVFEMADCDMLLEVWGLGLGSGLGSGLGDGGLRHAARGAGIDRHTGTDTDRRQTWA
jgi:hypothetical protein